MNIELSQAAAIHREFTPEAYAALRNLSEARVKKALNALVSATEDSDTWKLRGEITALRMFSELEEAVKNTLDSQK